MSLGKRPRQALKAGHQKIQNKKSKSGSNEKIGKPKTKKQEKEKGKLKAYIPIPGQSSDDQDSGTDLEEQDMIDDDLDDQDALGFLAELDKKAITRSRQDQVNENRKARPKNSVPSQAYRSLPKLEQQTSAGVGQEEAEDDEKLDELDEDDFALLGSDDDDEDLDLMSDMPSSFDGSLSTNSDHDGTLSSGSDDYESDEADCLTDDSALEKAYYASKRSKPTSADDDEEEPTESKLPVKLKDGTIQRFLNPTQPTSRAIKANARSTEPVQVSEPTQKKKQATLEDSSFGARFGRQPLVNILTKSNGKKAAARVEIADLAREAIADPEMSLGLLKRLIALCLPSIKAEDGTVIKIDPAIRFMAILSLLSVFLDIIPGYRIRALGEAEKQAAVSQMVARQREWEDGLVSVYKRFLEICEKEVVSAGVLAAVGLKCLCKLLSEKTYFNFSQNIMEVIVRKLGRKEWDEQSEACVSCLRSVLEKDTSGLDSLQVVRQVGRIIKSREFSVHPEVLACLLSVRLKDEITSGIRASTDKIHKPDGPKSSGGGGKLPWKDRKKAKTKPMVMSKKAKKAIKDRMGIEKEIQEAEETVRVEERERNQTETLKLLFALYFRIIKLPHRSVLFPAALDGLAKFAHLVNIDFFRDLMSVLRQHIEGNFFSVTPDEEEEDQNSAIHNLTRHRSREALGDKLVCILTAFELLSGQGEALNVDLTGFINDLYAVLIPLGAQLDVEDPPLHHQHSRKRSKLDVLLRALHLALLQPRTTIPPLRAQAFTKRLLTISLSLPPSSVLRIFGFLNKLLHRQPAIQSLFEQDEEKKGGGVYRAEVDDVGLCNAQGAVGWEVWALEKHWDERVREGVESLLRSVKDISS
ncbi:hypothetical protein CROQUDRAFT_48234 [Cronartium quercuum f. sp. fusiforme G11]|uniref:Nucleolar complex-associated protein 3 n=1 Tax=Cronartium quercuum f. sp. fusiforme G11 TaxID=708437 RepID=A0A9P6NDZ2_9BASI|nr:hypothetical protein CROQUDRAFT_48234 [Cronartium quercuum f. sp. fusiforme G11]